MATADTPFWKTKRLAAMTQAEWESLCDGCGRCCLHKLREDESGDGEAGRLHHTEVACRLLDCGTARCRDYAGRQSRVPDCIQLTPAMLGEIDWLPPSCAYRMLAEGRDLASWHPLVSGDPASVARAGLSVAGRCVNEREAGALEDHVRHWPNRVPRRAGPLPPIGSLTKGTPA